MTDQDSSDESFKQALDRARDGDRAAIAALLQACQDQMIRHADREVTGALRQRVSSADLVQESILSGFRRFEDFKGQTSGDLRQWMLRILRHNILDVARRYRAQCRDLGRDAGLDDAAHRLPSDSNTPSRVAGSAETVDWFLKTIESFPKLTQDILLAYFLEDKKVSEIAREFGVTRDVVAGHVRRGIEKLRRDQLE
jgi:RNA polymerase sigma-70 factor (ECF subfamily)